MSGQKNGDTTEKGGKKAVFVIGILVIVVLLMLVIYLLVTRDQGKDDRVVNRNVVVNEENVEQVLQELEEQELTPPGYYEVTMNSTWNFASGDAPSDNAYVKNAETNTNSVYFDVERADTGEIVYESPIIPVGSHIENITLGSDLEDGTYECIMTYHLLDEENRDVSTLKITVTLVIGQ